ncbi:MAG: hypothetical protein ACQET8_22275 [Bacillota bacterium]|nr:hypothetical protein [Fictibacillus sp. 18YEL24]
MLHRLHWILLTIAFLFTLVIYLWSYTPVEFAPIYMNIDGTE